MAIDFGLQILDAAGYDITGEMRPTNITWSTKMPGGLDTLTFDDEGGVESRFHRVNSLDASTCRLTGPGGEFLFYGYLIRPRFGMLSSQMTYVGPWATLFENEYFVPASRFPTGTPLYPHDVIKDLRRVASWNLQAVDTYVQSNWIEINDAEDFRKGGAGRTAGDVMIELLRTLGSDGNQWFAAIWADRILRYMPRPEKTTWVVDVNRLTGEWFLERDLQDVWSGMSMEYSVTGATDGARSRYGPTHDPITQKTIGRPRQKHWSVDSRQPISAAEAERICALGLREHNHARLRVSGGFTYELPRIETAGGVWDSTYMVRSGDVVEVTGLPAAHKRDARALNDVFRFHVVSTTYDSASGRLTMSPDYGGDDLLSIMARAIGGLRQKPVNI